MLQDAGFEDIRVTVNQAVGELVDEWAPGKNLAGRVASASIQARRPGAV